MNTSTDTNEVATIPEIAKIFVIKADHSPSIEGVLTDRVTAIETCIYLNHNMASHYNVHEMAPGMLYAFRDYRVDVNYHDFNLTYSTWDEYIKERFGADERNKRSEHNRLTRIAMGAETPESSVKRSFNTSDSLIKTLSSEKERLIAVRESAVTETQRAVDSAPNEKAKQLEAEYGAARLASIDRVLKIAETKLFAATS